MNYPDKDIAPIRVLLIDSHWIVLFGLEHLINSQRPRMEVVGKFSACCDVFPHLQKLSPNVILLGLNSGDENGADAVSRLVAASKANILIFTGLTDSSVFDTAMLAGAKGILQKQSREETILRAIEKIHEGQLWLNHASIRRLIVGLGNQPVENVAPRQRNIATLTVREKMIAVTLVDNAGASCKVIAQMLNISESTLRNHLSSIYEKLDVTNRSGLLQYAYQQGWNRDAAAGYLHEKTSADETPPVQRPRLASTQRNPILNPAIGHSKE
jgi:Response regulator containing a CheY-like receiver domain and an HTH DNA-binding domain